MHPCIYKHDKYIKGITEKNVESGFGVVYGFLCSFLSSSLPITASFAWCVSVHSLEDTHLRAIDMTLVRFLTRWRDAALEVEVEDSVWT